MTFPKFPRCFVLGAVAAVLASLAAPAQGEIPPEWVARLPVGSALAAGLSSMVVAADGVTFVTGTTGPSYNTDVLTAAFAPDGALIWSHVYNGPQDWHDQGRGIALGPDGVVWVTGNTPGPGNYANVLLLKYDAATGTLLQSILYSSAPFTSEHGGAIVVDAAGNVTIGGGTVGDGADALILGFDSNGQFRWKQVWDGPAFAPYSQDNALKVLLDPSGDPVVMIHGVMASLHPDYVVVKYAASDGAKIWETAWGVAGGDFPRDMEIDAAGDIYVTGTGLNFTNQFSTIKLRGSDGLLLWQAYDSAGADDAASALALDSEGGVYVTGTVDPDGDESNFNDNIYTVKRDAASGAQLWTHLYGQDCVGCFDVPTDILVDPAGHVFVIGSTSSPPYNADLILMLLDSASGLETDRGIVPSGTSQSAGAGILAFDASSNLFNGGRITNYDTGQVDMSVVKYTSLVGDLYRMEVPDLVVGADVTLSVVNATPAFKQYMTFSVHGLGATPVPRLGVTLDLADPHLLATGLADGSGAFQTTISIPPRAAGRTVWFQTAETGRTTPVVSRTVP